MLPSGPIFLPQFLRINSKHTSESSDHTNCCVEGGSQEWLGLYLDADGVYTHAMITNHLPICFKVALGKILHYKVCLEVTRVGI